MVPMDVVLLEARLFPVLLVPVTTLLVVAVPVRRLDTTDDPVI